MKIRNGFVSNSSSSSFMMVGVDYSSLTHTQKQLIENSNLEVDEEQDIAGISHYIGEYDTKSFSLPLIAKDELKIRCVLGEEVEVKVFVGMTYS